MESLSKKYMSSALLLFLSMQVNLAEAQEHDAVERLFQSDLPMATVKQSDAESDAGDREMPGKEEGEDEERIDSDGRVFGYRNGYLHTALGVSGEWTDNLFNTETEKEENFLTTISPSVWVTWPRRSRRPLQVAADNTAVGGLQYSQNEYEVYNKVELYFAGKMDFMTYSADSDLNHTEGGLQGQAVYKPHDRLALMLMDNYTHSQDIFNIAEANSKNNRVYDTNVLKAGADWRFSDKLSARLGYTNHVLAYDLAENNFMDRTDQGFDGTLAYDYSPKTDFFLGGSLLTAAYEEDIMPDNDNLFLQAGMNWQATVKTALMLRAGYQMVDYDEDWKSERAEALSAYLNDGEDNFSFEMQGIWQATRKSEFLLNAKYNVEQSDSLYALNKTVWASRLAYGYRFTGRIRGKLNFIYEDSDYTQFDGSSRLDERWNFSPSLDFALRKWLALTVYYSFDKKDSNFDELDYETNTLGIGARGTF